MIFTLIFISGGAAGALAAYIFIRLRVKDELEALSLRFQSEISVANERLREKTESASELKSRISGLESEKDQLTSQITGLTARAAELETALNSEKNFSTEKLKMTEASKEKLSELFKNLANDIFEEKNKKFSEISKTNIENVLNPLGEKIKSFEKKVEETNEKNIKERAALIEKISQLHELNKQLSRDAENLSGALRGNVKSQGNWGEMILETILQSSGLREGYEYETQKSLNAEDGSRFMPDIIVKLPENRCVVIDSKVSLNAYEKFCTSEIQENKDKALKAHIASIRSHVAGLSSKDYSSLKALNTLDFVLMFVPIESAFAAAVSAEKEIFTEAIRKNIIIVTPSTLLATLRTIAHIWRQEYQNKNASEIARRAGDMFDKFCAFIEDLESVGKSIDQAHSKYEEASKKLRSGRGNLIKTADDIRKLGLKVRKEIPGEMLDDASSEASLPACEIEIPKEENV
ncbi:MAG: hypothetical protein A2020_15780 [Lentisphaerae bacterium GWF2_45_14]|nr:MAG: hypothetical protein A2020_15780 [Lentisphaerae bacterium GWF2_45_14]